VKVLGLNIGRVSSGAPAPRVAPPANPRPAADTYEPAEGIRWARGVGKVKRWVARVGLMGIAGGALVAAAASPPVLGLALLAGGGLAAYGSHLMTKMGGSFPQESSLQNIYESTMRESSSLQQRTQAFAQLEDFLQRADLSSGGEVQRGTRDASVRTTPEGASILWKGPERGRQLRRNVPRHSENGREVAAYLVDKELGHYARVPPTIVRDDGIATFIVGGAKSLDDASQWLLSNEDAEGYRRIALFDQIIGNLDRHPRNFLLTEEGRTVPIDHGLAFPTSNGFQGMGMNYSFSKTVRLQSDEKKMLGDFVERRSQIEKRLSACLEPEAIDAMFERVESMLEEGRTTSGWRWTLG